MLKVLLYGYSYGIRSSRKLERALKHNITFIWLEGGLKPDHKTISTFRKKNKGTLKQVFKSCATLCLKLGVIKGNTLFLDGTKMQANASIDNPLDEKKMEEKIRNIETKIAHMLKECDVIDKQEKGQRSWVKLPNAIQKEEDRIRRIKEVLEEMKSEEKKTKNITDPDSIKLKTKKGSYSGYNAQVVTDDAHGLIVQNDVVQEHKDVNQIDEQISKANKLLQKNCKNACADLGYTSLNEI